MLRVSLPSLVTDCCCEYAVLRSYDGGNNGLVHISTIQFILTSSHIKFNSEFSTKVLYFALGELRVRHTIYNLFCLSVRR